MLTTDPLVLACASLLLSRRRKPKSIEQAKKVNKHSSKKVGKQTATEAGKKDASKAKIDEVKDAAGHHRTRRG